MYVLHKYLFSNKHISYLDKKLFLVISAVIDILFSLGTKSQWAFQETNVLTVEFEIPQVAYFLLGSLKFLIDFHGIFLNFILVRTLQCTENS